MLIFYKTRISVQNYQNMLIGQHFRRRQRRTGAERCGIVHSLIDRVVTLARKVELHWIETAQARTVDLDARRFEREAGPPADSAV